MNELDQGLDGEIDSDVADQSKDIKGDSLRGAFSKISILSERIWWNNEDYSDSYRLSNLSLWVDVINGDFSFVQPSYSSSNPPPREDQEDIFLPDPEELRELRKDYKYKEDPYKGINPMERGWDRTDNPHLLDDSFNSYQMDIESKFPVEDGANWLITREWPKSLLETYPSIPETLVASSTPEASSLYSKDRILYLLKNGFTVPYTIEGDSQRKLHEGLIDKSIKSIWKDGKTYKKTNILERMREMRNNNERESNYRLPVFYPSVSKPHQSHASYSSIPDSRYESDLFPYRDIKGSSLNQETWDKGYSFRNHSQTQDSGSGFNYESNQCDLSPMNVRKDRYFSDNSWRGFGAFPPLNQDQVVHRGNQRRRENGSRDRSEDYPLLEGIQMTDNQEHTETEDSKNVLNWLSSAYPKRARELEAISTLACRLEELSGRLSGAGGGGGGATSSSPRPTNNPGGREEKGTRRDWKGKERREKRRLYRDVLASKEVTQRVITSAAQPSPCGVVSDSQTGLLLTGKESREEGRNEEEVKYEELEREALEQYRASQTSLLKSDVAAVSGKRETNPEEEEFYQDLEREAMEQYQRNVGEEPIEDEGLMRDLDRQDKDLMD